jgi:hypothetical protein
MVETLISYGYIFDEPTTIKINNVFKRLHDKRNLDNLDLFGNGKLRAWSFGTLEHMFMVFKICFKQSFKCQKTLTKSFARRSRRSIFS